MLIILTKYLNKKKKKMKINIIGFTGVLFGLGAIAYLINSYAFSSLVTILYGIGFLFLIYAFMLYPLYNYFFGLIGIRNYKIKKGKHRSNLFYFKPMLFGDIYIFKPEILTSFEDVSLSVRQKTQINKLFGVNYGLPSLDKGFSLVHKNSIRLGYNLINNQPNYVIYVRKGDTTHTKYLKDDIVYFVLNTRKHSIDIYYSDKTHDYLEYDKLIKTSFFGYYLSKPFFGGKATAPKDIYFNYIVKKY